MCCCDFYPWHGQIGWVISETCRGHVILIFTKSWYQLFPNPTRWSSVCLWPWRNTEFYHTLRINMALAKCNDEGFCFVFYGLSRAPRNAKRIFRNKMFARCGIGIQNLWIRSQTPYKWQHGSDCNNTASPRKDKRAKNRYMYEYEYDSYIIEKPIGLVLGPSTAICRLFLISLSIALWLFFIMWQWGPHHGPCSNPATSSPALSLLIVSRGSYIPLTSYCLQMGGEQPALAHVTWYFW